MSQLATKPPAPKQFVRPRTGKFRLLAGGHIQDNLDLLSDEELLKLLRQEGGVVDPVVINSRNRLLSELRRYQTHERIYKPNDIFENRANLARRSPEKFARVDDRAKVSPGTPTKRSATDEVIDDFQEELELESDLMDDPSMTSAITSPQAAQAPPKLNLDSMNLKQLQELAEDREIENAGRKNREELLKILKTALA